MTVKRGLGTLEQGVVVGRGLGSGGAGLVWAEHGRRWWDADWAGAELPGGGSNENCNE